MNTQDINKMIDTNPPERISKVVKSSKSGKALTRKQKAFADALMSDPKKTQRQAYQEAYDTKPGSNIATIDVSASKLIREPQVVSYLSRYNDLAENTILNTINEWGNSPKERQRELAVNASMWVHDKVHGKATQRIQQDSRVFKFTMDLTGDTTSPEATGDVQQGDNEVTYQDSTQS